MKLLSLRAYARHRGCALRAVQKAIESGRIQLVTDADGRKGIDPDASDLAWEELTDQSKQRDDLESDDQVDDGEADAADDGGDDPAAAGDSAEASADKARSKSASAYQTARAAREAYVARIKQLEYEEMAGKLIPVAEVEKRIFEVTRITRDSILNIPNRLSAELASEMDPHKVFVLLTRELNQALEELAHAGERSTGR